MDKTDSAIDRSSHASGEEDKIGEKFDVQIHRETHSSSHRGTDEGIVVAEAQYHCAQQNS